MIKLKKLIQILILLLLPVSGHSGDNILIDDLIIGSWQSIDSDSDYDGCGKPSKNKILFWKRYRNNGNVEVIYGNGTKWIYTGKYLIEDGKLYETSTHDGINSITFPEKQKKWDYYFLKKDGVISDISFINGKLKLSDPEFEMWTVYKRQEHPDPELANMPDINQSLEKEFRMLSEIVPNQKFVKYSQFLNFFNMLQIHNEDIWLALHIIEKSYDKKEPIDSEKTMSFLTNFNHLIRWTGQPKKGERINPEKRYFNLSEYRFVYIGKGVLSNETWYYEYGKGWYKPSVEQLVKTEE